MEISTQLPEWNLIKVDENEVPKLGDFKGKPLLILFFSLGCPGCKGRAIPFANLLKVTYLDKIAIFGIHTHFEGAGFTDEELLAAKEELYFRFPIYRDFNSNTTFLDYQAGGTPHWILVDENSNILYSIFGSDPNNALLRLDLKIQEIL